MCVCVSQKCGSVARATFYGKVSFPPLCPQRLPDTDRACRLCVWRTDAAGFREQHRKSSDRVGASEVKAGSSSKPASVRPAAAFLDWFRFFHPVVCGVLTSCF